MITCVVEYVIDPAKTDAFERFARRWMELVDRHGGRHHGYFLPAEGASDKALALFSFPSLAAYEQYRGLFGEHPDFVAADRIRDESGCVLRYERTFMRPLLPGDAGANAVTGKVCPVPRAAMSPAVVLSNPLPRRTSDAQRDLFDGRLT